MKHVLLLGALFLATPAQAASVLVLICNVTERSCTLATARISFQIPVENELPTACLEAGMQKIAQVSDLKGEDEAVIIKCDR